MMIAAATDTRILCLLDAIHVPDDAHGGIAVQWPLSFIASFAASRFYRAAWNADAV